MKARELLCRACELEAELGTMNVPHPIDGRVHTCSTALDPDAPDPILALQVEIEHERTRANQLRQQLAEAQYTGAGKLYDWLKLNGYVIALPQPSRYRHGAMDLQAAILPREWAIEAAINNVNETKES